LPGRAVAGESRLGVTLLDQAKQKLFRIASRFVSKATLVEGDLKGTELRLRCLLVGSSPFTDDLKRRTYDQPPSVLRQWRLWTPSLKRVLVTHSPSFDLCVAVLPMSYEPMFRGLYDYKGTEDVRQVIATTEPWEEVRKAFVKKKRQITNDFEEKHGLSYRISSDPADFDLFYHRMHVPHIRKRYGELSDIDSYEEMKWFFEKGILLFVTREGRDVAGALSAVRDGMLVFRRSGVLDGDETHVKGGAQTALYYFQLRHAVEKRYRAVDTMKSAPFLNDGVYRHKAEWGATVLPDDEARNWVYFFAAAPSQKAAHFFELNPVIVQSADGLRAVVGDPRCAGTPNASFDELVQRYPARGLRGFTVVSPVAVLAVP
jgi:hypothetical protein